MKIEGFRLGLKREVEHLALVLTKTRSTPLGPMVIYGELIQKQVKSLVPCNSKAQKKSPLELLYLGKMVSSHTLARKQR